MRFLRPKRRSSLEFILFILIAADIDEWVEQIVRLFDTLHQMCSDASDAADIDICPLEDTQ